MSKASRIEVVCRRCGAAHRETRSRIKTWRGQYCSKECRDAAQKEAAAERRQRWEEMQKNLYTESASGEKRLPHSRVRIRITESVPVWPQYRPEVGAVYQAERYPCFYQPGYVIESGGKRINIRAAECAEV